ncbi:hypothetical protein [Sulfurimonas xiamenensis]|jgi:Ca2+/Na+ antiporter|uniref:Uncharacterized protein n=1 Tax=Sulfurimonas xiamenensis TaxID=2590021 RepID=A0AAJ4DLK5_9BACT|nr:hypothetical protein [Sulfurimonas xiamenensis]QFR42397.1 hypothetical protein FJR47_00045 [Sulfurimonas xiamenensis]
MDGSLYIISLIVVVLLAFVFYRSNSFKLMLLVLAVGIYIIYAHKSGNTPSKVKNEIIESIDKSAKDFSKSRGVEKYDEEKIKKEVAD